MGKRKNTATSTRGSKKDRTSTPELNLTTESSPDLLRQQMLYEMRQVGYDGEEFATFLENGAKDRLKRRCRSPRQVRWRFYCDWAYALIKKEIGPDHAQFAFPPAVLSFIRCIAPGDIVGEIREDAHKVTMEDFCDAMEMPVLLK